MESKKENILFCPLDWGIGHASRIVPLIQEQLDLGNNVYFASSGAALDFLKIEFPAIPAYELPSYQIRFGKKNGVFKLALRFFDFYFIRKREHQLIEKIVLDLKINKVISDNRYGAFSKECKSIFITHQLRILLPKPWSIFEFFPNFVHKMLVKNFDEIWVPDFHSPNSLSGKLSQNTEFHQNIKFIGWLSRFKFNELKSESEGIFAWVSGPEPQRTAFSEKLIGQLSVLSRTSVLVLGQPGMPYSKKIGNLTIYNHLPSNQFQTCIKNAELVICRSGYSSLMDLVILQKKALIVACKGQSEQEYLANYCHKNGYFLSQTEDKLDIEKALNEIHAFNP